MRSLQCEQQTISDNIQLICRVYKKKRNPFFMFNNF